MKKNPQTINFCPECGKFLKIIKSNTDYYYSCTVCGHIEKAKLDLEALREETHLDLEYEEVDPTKLAKFKKWKEKYLKSELMNFICPYCNSTKAYIYYRHMRSYSKPTNLFIECINCNKLLRSNNP